MDPYLETLVSAGLLDYSEALDLMKMLDPEVARFEAERRMAATIEAGLSAQQRRLLALLRRTNNRPTGAQLDAFWQGEDALFWQNVRPDVLDVVAEQATVTAAVAVATVDTWGRVAEDVLRWTETHYTSTDTTAFGSIPNLNVTSRTRFQAVFTRWLQGDLPGQGIDEEGLPTGRGITDLILDLEPVFGSARAEAIGVTETTRIFSMATRATGDQDPNTAAYRWLVAGDERVCGLCGPMHGQVQRKGETFQHPTLGGIDVPAHPRCRCEIVPETDLSLAVPFETDYRFTGKLPTPATARKTAKEPR